ncbi:MAG TPA: hemerythrin domain-containing protein [Verrucomicrobiae bacterium]|jgi:hemerythrin-like domain-containing protein|nr:hemerythrin domain-containing protein [Verrucomicrobiae bacterium]
MQNAKATCTGACHGGEHDLQRVERSTEVLTAEHRIIETVLEALEKLAQTAETSALADWAKAIDFLRNFADKCHHLKEETLLFPTLEEHGIPREGGPIGMMLAEHEEGRGFVRAMAAAVDTGARDVLRREATAYIRLLRQHILKEDEVLFQMADSILSAEEQQKLLRDFEEHELREIGPGFHEKYLQIARDLT